MMVFHSIRSSDTFDNSRSAVLRFSHALRFTRLKLAWDYSVDRETQKLEKT